MGRLGIYRVLSVGHYLIALPLLGFAGFFGLILVPVLAAGPVWLCIVGTDLWDGPSLHVCRRIRITHLFALIVSAMLIAMGMFARKAAELSAARGGGLLGAWALIPLTVGGLLALLAMLSLAIVRSNAVD